MKSVGMVGLVVGVVCVGFVACGNSPRDFEAAAGAAGAETEAGAAGKPTGSAGSGKAGSTSAAGSATAGAAGEEPSEGGSGGTTVAGGTGGTDTPAAGSGGTPAGGAPAGGSGGTAPVDTTPPSVVSVVPANNAKGIAIDQKIVVTFSEAVNKTAAQAAFTSSAGALSFSWNGAGTVVTATPSTAFSYGTTAKAYTVQVSTGLADLAGNHSTAAFNSTFSLLRELTLKITRPVIGTWTVSTYPSASQSQGDSSPSIGDGFGSYYDRAIPDFDISSLPAGIVEIESASMTLPISLKNPIAGDVDWGNPLVDLGDLVVDHIYEANITAATVTKAALNRVGTLMTAAVATSGPKTIEVTSSLADDYANRVARANHSQYRVQFTKTTDNDAKLDLVAINFSQTMSLDVEYLIP